MASIQSVERRRTGAILAAQQYVIPPTPPDPPSGDPSGVDMPTTAPSGWQPLFRQNFNTPCARGSFLAVYGGAWNPTEALTFGRFGAYPTTSKDSRLQHVGTTNPPVDGHGGRYDPAGISCVDGKMQMHIWWDPTLDGTGNMRVCAPVARMSNISTWGDIGSSIQTVRARYVGSNRTMTKIAWLRWPSSNKSSTLATAGIPDSTSTTGFRGGDGEYDWPEQDDGDHADWFMHKQNAKTTDTSSQKQSVGASTVDFYDGNWHTWQNKRVTGSYNTTTSSWVGQLGQCFVDGVQVGVTQTASVPMTTMRWVLQTETSLGRLDLPLDQTLDYLIEVDWMTVDVPV